MGDGVASIIDGGSVRVSAPLDVNPAGRIPVDGRESAGRAGERGGQGHHQFAHRHGGDQQQCAGEPGGRLARLSVGQHQGGAEREPAGCPSPRPGTTTVVNNSIIKVDQGSNHMFLFNPGVELEQIVRAVNDVGAAPGDLVAILEALKEAGALQAELIVI